MSWITTKLLAYVSGGLLLACLASLSWGAWERQGKLTAEANENTAKANERTAKLSLSVALAANEAGTAIIKSLEGERDALLLKRAIEKQQAEKIVAETEYKAQQIAEAYLAAKGRIRQLSMTANCMAVMSAPICPEIEAELRAP